MKDYEKLLDDLLRIICTDNSGGCVNMVEVLRQQKIESDEVEILVLAQKLVEDGYIELTILEQHQKLKDGLVQITQLPDRDNYYKRLNGIMFLNSGGYQGQLSRQNEEKWWIRVKIVAGVLNALTIIAVGIASVYFSIK